MPIEMPSSVVEALAEGRQAHVALDLSSGPQVTPNLYAWSGDRLWMAAASTTVKAKVTDDSPTPACVVVRLPGRDVVLSGSLESFDIRKPVDLAKRLGDLPDATVGALRFGLRNAADLLAFAGDALAGRLGVPPPRVLLSLTPDAALLLENDAIVESAGPHVHNGEGCGTIPTGGTRVVAAFPGPVAVPARWFADEANLRVTSQLVDLFDLERTTPVAVVSDEYTAPGPAAKRGLLLRGEAVPTSTAGSFDVTVCREVEWDGVEVTASDAGAG